MAYQSLYRRFRPQRFSDVVGQDHLVAALQNALRDDRVGHAYLFSGPRGTGKTTSARLLAKALNCTNLGDDGEPCCACDACLAIESGTSMDLVELDAASNNGVDSIRELVASASLGSPGQRKVYILDEVHMLSTAASNALLKTLEEPPSHVVFVLATTDPQKVLATIRSRTQHIELSLIGAQDMDGHVRDIASRGGIDIDDETVDYVIRKGGGSSRDTLSALDQVVAAGGMATEKIPVGDLVEALIARDSGAALTTVAAAVSAGADAREMVETLARHLRDLFLVQQQAAPSELPPAALETLTDQGRRLGAASTVRALETLGAALVDARQAADPRLVVEVALVKLTAASSADDLGAILARLEHLEAIVANGATVTAPPVTPGSVVPDPPSVPSATPPDSSGASPSAGQIASGAAPSAGPRTRGSGRVSAARAALGQPASTETPSPKTGPTPPHGEVPPPPPPPPAPSLAGPSDTAAPTLDAPGSTQTDSAASPPSAEPVEPGSTQPPSTPADAAPTTAPSISQLRAEWIDTLTKAPGLTKNILGSCDIDSPTPGHIVCHVSNEITRERCVAHVPAIQDLLSSRYGLPMTLELTVEAARTSTIDSTTTSTSQDHPTDEADEVIDPNELTDAPVDATSGVDRLTAAFPGAKIIDDPTAEY